MNLSQAAFDILLALAQGPSHGYAMIKSITNLRGGDAIQPGLLYTTLPKLIDAGLIKEIEPPASGDARRRYYAITAAGKKELILETERAHARMLKIQKITKGLA